jgi:hypothetical protein
MIPSEVWPHFRQYNIFIQEDTNLDEQLEELNEAEQAGAKEQAQDAAHVRHHITLGDLHRLGDLCPQQLLIEYIQVQEPSQQQKETKPIY